MQNSPEGRANGKFFSAPSGSKIMACLFCELNGNHWESSVAQIELLGCLAQLRMCFRCVASGSSARRPARRNRSVLDIHEDFEHRATKQSGRVAAFKTRSEKKRCFRHRWSNQRNSTPNEWVYSYAFHVIDFKLAISLGSAISGFAYMLKLLMSIKIPWRVH